ncbi:MAG: DUF2723 domain-containing protein [bacterium]
MFRIFNLFKEDKLILTPFKTIDYIFGILVFFVSFGVYLHTLTPTVGFHDSGELITCAYTLGIAHPPGYPLYTLLGKVFVTLIPIGNIAFRMNMQSALFASLCVMMVYFITLRLTNSIIPSIVASLILAFSATFWEQAVIAEKYTLNALFASLIIFILLKWEEGLRLKASGLRLLYLFSFILGLSFTHHFQTIYLVPASIFFILAVSWKNRKRLKASDSRLKTFSFRIPHSAFRNFLMMFLLFILPLTLWLYLPIRASQNPILNWGDPRNLDNFLIHILAKSYTGYFSSIKQSFIRFSSHLNFFPLQFSKYILWIFLFSLPFFLKRKILFLFFLLIFIVNSLHSIRYTIVNICDYYIPSFILTSILIGLGLSLLTRFIPFLSFFLLLLISIPYFSNHFQNNRARFFFSYDYGMNILRPLKKEAIVISYGDYESFPLWYLKYVEERRNDVASLTNMFLPCDWHISSIKMLHPKISFEFEKIPYKELKYHNIGGVIKERLDKIIKSNFSKFPIYIGPGIERFKDFIFLPEGLFFQVVQKEELKKEPGFLIRDFGFRDRVASVIFNNYSLSYNEMGNLYRKKDLNQAISFYKKALNIEPSYHASRLNLAFSYLDKNEYDKAEENLKIILKENKDFEPALVHYGFGIVYQNKKDFKMAISEYTQALKIDPKNTSVKDMLEECKKKIVDKN